MADRYAVNTGTNWLWDSTAGTKWATTSGGAGGASAPTNADRAIFDANSGSGTITTATSAVCSDLATAGFTGQISWTSQVNIWGSMTLGSGGTFSGGTSTNGPNMRGGGTITSNGKTLPYLVLDSSGATTQLADALIVTNTITHSRGGFQTNNQSWTAASYTSANSNTRSQAFGSSSIALTGGGTAWNTGTTTGLTVNANTATVTMTGTGVTWAGGTKDYNGLSLVISGAGSGTTIQGGSTFANVTRTGTAVKTDALLVGTGGLTVTGTFTTNGNSVTNRLLVASTTAGIQATIIAAAVSASNVDLLDITLVGFRAWTVGGTGGNLLTANQSSVETNTTGWANNSNATVARSTAQSLDGAASLSMTANAAGDVSAQTPNGISGSAFAVTAGVTYVAEAYLRAATAGRSIRMGMRFYDASGAQIGSATTSADFVDTTSGWSRIVTSAVAPANAAFGGIYVMAVGAALGETHYVDQVGWYSLSNYLTDLSAITGDSGNAGGNSGITFTPSLTLYYVTGGWATTSGGAATARAPLPQDTIRVDAASPAALSVSASNRFGSIDTTGWTGTFSLLNSSTWYGSWTIGTGTTFSFTSTQTLAGRGSHTLTWNGRTITASLVISAATGTYTLQDAFISNRANTILNVTSGTLNTNGQSVTSTAGGGALLVSGTSGTLAAGGSTFTFSGTASATFWNYSSGTITGSPNIVLAGATTSTRTFAGGGQQYGTLTYTVADSLGAVQISGSNIWAGWNIGPGRQVILTSGTTQQVNPAGWNVDGEDRDYVYRPDVAGAYMSTPDHASLDITGDIDLIARITPADWTPSQFGYFATKYDFGANQRSYRFGINTTGNLILVLSVDGTASATSTSSQVVGATDGTTRWVRATYRQSDRRVQFFTAPGGTDNTEPAPGDWTPLGVDQTNTSTAIFSSTSPLRVGDDGGGGTGAVFVGRLHRTIVKNGLAGTIVADWNAALHANGQNTYTDTTGKVWTLNGFAENGDGRVVVNAATSGTLATISASMTESTGKPVYFAGDARTRDLGYMALDGTGDQAWSPYHSSFVMTSGFELTTRARATDWTAAAAQFLLGRALSSTSEMAYDFYADVDGTISGRWSSDGTGTGVSTVLGAHAFADNTTYWMQTDRVTATGVSRVQKAVDSTTEPAVWTLIDSDTEAVGTLPYAGSTALYVGARGTALTIPFTGRIYRSIVRDGPGGSTVFDADFTATPPNIGSDYLRIKDIKVIGHAAWYAGSHSVDVSGNSYWFWNDAPSVSSTWGIKIGGVFVNKPLLIKVGGTFIEKPMKVKVAGTWVP